MALAIGAIMSSNVIAAKNNTSADIDQRLAELEQRLINAEQRAADAEAQIQTLKQQQTAAAKTASAVKVDAAEPVAGCRTTHAESGGGLDQRIGTPQQ